MTKHAHTCTCVCVCVCVCVCRLSRWHSGKESACQSITTVWQAALSDSLQESVSSWAVQIRHGNVLQGSENAVKHSALTLEVRSSGQTWKNYILEVRPSLIDRGMIKHCFLMPYFSRSSIPFPEFCVLTVTHCFKTLAQRSFFSSNSP